MLCPKGTAGTEAQQAELGLAGRADHRAAHRTFLPPCSLWLCASVAILAEHELTLVTTSMVYSGAQG
jgi:hypothetical protein